MKREEEEEEERQTYEISQRQMNTHTHAEGQKSDLCLPLVPSVLARTVIWGVFFC